MYFTGFADEAGAGVDAQIRVTRALGWKHIEARKVQVGTSPAGMIHDVSEADFNCALEQFAAAGISINCFGSAVANWGKKIEDPFDITLAEIKRCIPRMQKAGTKLIRIMSYAVRNADDQMEAERFRRLREICRMFADEGLTAVHENCMNYGGMGWLFTLKLVENVPGLKLVFDTGNPVFSDDRSGAKPWPKQSSWDFYKHIREHVVYVHIKDGKWDPARGKCVYSYPGEGDGDVRRIFKDLIERNYAGGISIEPHMGAVFHDPSSGRSLNAEQIYVEYGRRMMAMEASIRAELRK